MSKNCLNKSNPNINKISKQFGDTKTSELLDKYYPNNIPTFDEFISNVRIKEELNIVPISKVKDILGTSFYKNIPQNKLNLLKKLVSKINNKLIGSDVIYRLFNIRQIGQADLYTWGLRKTNGKLDIDAKIEKAIITSRNTIQSNDKIDNLEKLKKASEPGTQGRLFFSKASETEEENLKEETFEITETGVEKLNLINDHLQNTFPELFNNVEITEEITNNEGYLSQQSSNFLNTSIKDPFIYNYLLNNSLPIKINKETTINDLLKAGVNITNFDTSKFLIDDKKGLTDAQKTALINEALNNNDPQAQAAGRHAKNNFNNNEVFKPIVEKLNSQRLERLEEWKKYITEENTEYANNPFIQKFIWDMITKGASLSNTDIKSLSPQLNQGVLAEIVYNAFEKSKDVILQLPTSKDVLSHYSDKIAELALSSQEKLEVTGKENTIGQWIYIPSSTEDSENFEANVKKLQALSYDGKSGGRDWCTRTFNAKPYLEKGGFYLYIEKDENEEFKSFNTKIAIRLNSDNTIQEIQGHYNDGTIPLEYVYQINQLRNSNIKLHPKQKVIQNRITNWDSMVDKAEKDYKTALKEFDNIKKSILENKYILEIVNKNYETNIENIITDKQKAKFYSWYLKQDFVKELEKLRIHKKRIELYKDKDLDKETTQQFFDEFGFRYEFDNDNNFFDVHDPYDTERIVDYVPKSFSNVSYIYDFLHTIDFSSTLLFGYDSGEEYILKAINNFNRVLKLDILDMLGITITDVMNFKNLPYTQSNEIKNKILNIIKNNSLFKNIKTVGYSDFLYLIPDNIQSTKAETETDLISFIQELKRNDLLISKSVNKNSNFSIDFYSKEHGLSFENFNKNFYNKNIFPRQNVIIYNNKEYFLSYKNALNTENLPYFRRSDVIPEFFQGEYYKLENGVYSYDWEGEYRIVSKEEFEKAYFDNDDSLDEFKALYKETLIPEVSEKENNSFFEKLFNFSMTSNKIEGVYNPVTDKIQISSNNINTLERAEEVFLHEVVGHRGVENLLSSKNLKEYNNIILGFSKELDKKVLSLIKKSGYTNISDFENDYGFKRGSVEYYKELIARVAENQSIYNDNKSWFDKLLLELKLLLSKIFKINFTNKDIAQFLIKARKSAINSKPILSSVDRQYSQSNTADEVENKSELETFLEEIEQYPTEELSPIVGEYYDILSRHLNDLVNNKNYTKLKELFTEDKVNKVEKIQDIVRRANKLKDTISKQKQQALALAKTVIQLDYLIDKVEVKIEDIIKNEQDALLNLEELQRYLDMINNWNQLLKVAAEKFPKTKVEEKVILTQNKITRIKKNIILNDKSGMVSMLKEVLGDYSMKYNINAQEELQKLKTLLERKIKNKRSPEDIEKAKKKVELKQQEIDALDFEVGNNILDFLEGRRGDVNAFFTSIRAYRDSSNPTIFGFATYMRDLIDNNINKAYNWGIAYERELDLTQLDRLNPSIMGKAITFVDKSGDIMLLNKWKDYKFDLNALRDIEKAALVDFNSSNTDEKEEIYLKARKDRTDFEKDYMYREFTDAYYEKFELFEDPIGKSLKEDIDFIFNQIKDIDAKVGDMQPTQEELDIKAALLRSYNQLGSIYAKNKKKEGDALLKAERMRQYRKINSKIYDYIPDYNLFEEAKEKFKDYLVTDLELSETSPEYAQELLKWTQANTRTVISQKYYEDVENLMLKLKVLFDRSQNKEIKEDIVKQWEIIKDAIYSNKDEDNQPIGSIIDPFPSEKIKSAQETIESLIQLGRELGNLTPNQLQRLKELEDLQEVSELSESENIELRELNSLHSMSSASDRARLKVLLQELSELQSKVPTTYYIDEFNSFSAALGIIIDDNGNVDWDAFSEEENIPQGVSILNSPKLDELLENPEFNDWFNKNHIKVKKFNKETFEYEIVWQRTFQWSVNKPNDAKYYEILPSQAYTNREVKPEFKTGYNKNTKQVELIVGEHITNLSKYDFLPDPNKIKSAEYANQKYYDLKNAKDSTSKRYFKNLEIHTKRSLQAQENAMYTAKIWLNVPAALKTSQENLVGSIKSVKNPSTIAKNVKNRVKSIKEGINNFSEDPDINFKSPLEKEEEEKNKRYKNSYAQDFFKIPIKFTAAKEADLISLDLQRSYSLYNESVSRNKLLLEKLPIAKSLKRLLEDTNEDNTKDSVKNTLTAVLDIIMREFEGSTSYRDIENNKSVISGVKVLKTLAGAALIKFNIMAAKVNLLTATFQNFIFSNNQLYNSVGYYKSLYTYKKIFIPGILADKIGNRIGKRSLASQMFVLWQPVMGMNIEDYIGDKTGNSTGINLVEHYNPVKLLRDLSEGLVQSRPWVAALRTAKVERTLPDGSKDIIDLWDIYELDADGFLTVKEGVDKEWLSGGKLFNKKKSEIQQFIRHRQGNYDPRDKTKYETSFFSSIPFFLKKFYISTGSALFYASLPNDAPWTDYFRLKGGDTLGGEPRGMLYQTVQVGHFIITNNIRNWSTLTMQDKKAVQKTALFITSLVILDLLIKMYFGYRGDDKNKKENLEKYSWWEFQMIIMLIKVRQQLDTFTSVIAGYDTISSNSLFIGLKKWIDVWEAALPYYDIDEKEIKMDARKATKRNIKGELIYEKGDLILPDKILNAFGIESIENYYKNPDQTLKGMSSQQQ